MGQTLTNGIYLPDEGERNSYSGLEANWRTLDALILTVDGKAAPNIANTWTAAQTFTAGIVGDLTGNVTGNVTGNLTGTASKAIADEDGTSIKSGYVNVAGDQTVTGDKSFTGSNTFNNILPNATNTYSLGSSSYQWSSVYAQTYYYNGTAWGLDKENVWTGDNSFTSGFFLKNTSWSGATPPSSTKTTVLEFKNSDTLQNRIASRVSSSASEMWLETTRNVDSNTSHTLRLTIFVDSAGNCIFAPYNPNNTDLGTSNNGYKWKTLNGINPGALSLPDKSKAISIDTTSLVYGSEFAFTPTVSGWLFVSVTNCTRASLKTGAGEYYFNQSSGIFRDTIPVIAGEQVMLLLISTATSAPTVTLFPCLGNV